MPSGYTASLPNDMIWDVGVLSHDVATVQTALFATRGGVNVLRNIEMRSADFDGRRVKIAGLDRKVGSDPRFEGTAVQIDETLLAKFEPGSTTVTAGTPAVHTITPLKQSTTIAKSTMLVKPRLTWLRSGGGTVYVQFPLGLVVSYDIRAVDKTEGEIPFAIESRIDPAAVGFTTDDEGYIWVVTEPA
jgi:hypothetical protein